MIIVEILKSHFNVGTEKAKENSACNVLCSLEHMPLRCAPTKIMVDSGNYLIHKKLPKEDNNKITCDSVEFKTN